MKPEQIKDIRGKLSQKDFAFALFELSQEVFPEAPPIALSTIRNWEQGRTMPDRWGAYLLWEYRKLKINLA